MGVTLIAAMPGPAGADWGMGMGMGWGMFPVGPSAFTQFLNQHAATRAAARAASGVARTTCTPAIPTPISTAFATTVLYPITTLGGVVRLPISRNAGPRSRMGRGRRRSRPHRPQSSSRWGISSMRP